MRQLKQLVLGLILLAGPAQADDRWPDAGGGGSGGGSFAACRNGSTPGFNYDSSTGLYAETCGDYNWHGNLDPTQATASYSVTCTGPNEPDPACPAADYILDIGYPIHRFGVASFYTAPGGKVYLTNRRGKNYRLYVNRGAGLLEGTSTNATYPEALQWWWRDMFPDMYSVTGPLSQVRTVQALMGVQFVTETPCHVYYEVSEDGDCPFPVGSDQRDICQRPVYTGVCILDDRGREPSFTTGIVGPASGRSDLDSVGRYIDGAAGVTKQQYWPYLLGSWNSPYCRPTSNSNWDCNFTTNDATQWSAYAHASTTIAPIGNITTADSTGPYICIDNSIGTAPAPTNGATAGCAEAPAIQCSVAGTGNLASAGGCCVDTNASGTCTGADLELGPCLGNVDLVEYLVEEKGLNIVGQFIVPHCRDTVGVAADCTTALGATSFYATPTFIDSGAGCVANSKSVSIGQEVNQTFSTGPIDRLLSGHGGVAQVLWTTREFADQQQTAFHGLGFIPANPVNTWSPTTLYTGTTSTTSAVATTMTVAETPDTLGTNTIRGYTLTINKGLSDFCIRTVSANTATSITWTGGTCDVASGDTWEVSRHGCMSSSFGGVPSSIGSPLQDEVACDSTDTTIGLWSGEAHDGGVYNGALLCSGTGGRGCIDEGTTSMGWKIVGNSVDFRRGVVHDPAGVSGEVHSNRIFGDRMSISTQTVFTGLGTGYHIHNNIFSNLSALLWGFAYYADGYEFDHNVMDNMRAGSALAAIQGGKGMYLHDNIWRGSTPAQGSGGIQITPSAADIQSIVIERERIEGLNSEAAWVFVLDSSNRVSQITIRDIDISTRYSANCGVVVDAVNIGADAQTILVEGVDIEGSQGGHRAFCVGATADLAPTSRTAAGNVQYHPHTRRNSSNDTLEADIDRVCRTAAQWGDADTGVTELPPGVYCIADDDGTCTDTGADGTLDGGDTIGGAPDPPAECKWDGTAWVAPGAW